MTFPINTNLANKKEKWKRKYPTKQNHRAYPPDRNESLKNWFTEGQIEVYAPMSGSRLDKKALNA